MDCPVCKNPMVTLELQQVEVDFCSHCGGIWLDAGELELLLGQGQDAKQLLNSFEIDQRGGEKKRRCPICLKKMEKAIISSSEHPVRIDRCIKRDGLWFDQGELQEVLTKGRLDQDSKIQKLLGDMFNIGQKNAN